MSKNVLIIDDHPDVVDFFEEVLQEDGYVVCTADHGRTGLDTALANPFDAIILDVMLPGLSGRQVHERLRANPGTATVPVIFITAERGDDVSDLLGPHTYYLRKAIDLGTLKKLVADVSSGKSRA